MLTKLTLTIDKEVIERAKIYAGETGRSLSEMVQAYLKTLTSEGSNPDLSPSVKAIAGKLKLPADFDEKKELQDYFSRKHL